MIIYLCIKFESNILIFSKEIERKPFLLRTDWTDVCQTVGILYVSQLKMAGALIKLPHPLLNVSQSDYLIQVMIKNSHTE